MKNMNVFLLKKLISILINHERITVMVLSLAISRIQDEVSIWKVIFIKCEKNCGMNKKFI